MRPRRPISLGGVRALVAGLYFASGCGGRSIPGEVEEEPPLPRCVEGHQIACACADGSTGAQVCNLRGRYGSCECETPARGGTSSAGTSSRGGSSSATGGVSNGGSSGQGGTSSNTGGKGGTAGKGGTTGEPEPTGSIELEGKIERLAYEAREHVMYGIDSVNRRLVRIDLVSEEVTYASVVQVPHALCVDVTRESLFVVNSGSTIVSRHALDSLDLVAQFDWGAPTYEHDDTHFHIHCGKDRLYLVDGMRDPGLWTIEDLDGMPMAVDRTEMVSGVGDLALSNDETSLYLWYQSGWSAGLTRTEVKRFSIPDFALMDETGVTDGFYRDPLDTPILVSESRGVVLAKNRILDPLNLERVIFTITSPRDRSIDGAEENAYAADFERGRFATKKAVYSLDAIVSILSISRPNASQLLFDRSGRLYFLETAQNRLDYVDLDP